MLLKRR